MESVDAVRMIEGYLATGRDVALPFSFSVGPDGRLRTFPSLRVFLLDMLGIVDPGAAAFLGERALVDIEGQSVDEYAIHLKNYADGTTDPPAGRGAFLRDRTLAMLRRDDWMSNPTPGMAEAFDFFVYLDATELVGELGAMTAPDRPQLLRKAAFITLDQLVLRNPEEVFRELIDHPESMVEQGKTRAGFFARADFSEVEERRLLEDYLLSPEATPGELDYFFNLYPNLNFTLSDNLMTDPQVYAHDEIIRRLNLAVDALEVWRLDPRFAPFADDLAQAQARIIEILGE